MKNLKLITLTTLITIGGAITVNAQDGAAKQPVKKQLKEERAIKFEELKTELNLSDEQVSKIKAIQAQKEIEKKAQKEKIQEINRDEREEINQVLTDEQKAKLRAKRLENRKSKAVNEEKPTQKVAAPQN